MSTTTPSSPIPREYPPFVDTEEGVYLVLPNGPPSSAYQPLHDVRDDSVKEKSSRLDVMLESHCVALKGTGDDVEPAFLTGRLLLTLAEPMSLKEIGLQFQGKVRLPVPANESIINNSTMLTCSICNHDWSFLEGDKRHSHTLKAGRHIFPFQLRIGGSLPSSICTCGGGAAIYYQLRAHATRPGFSYNLHANVPVRIIRSFSAEALEYQQTLEIENTWPDKLMYSIMIPHKAWAVGDAVTAIIKLSPLNKGISVISIATSLHETTSVYARSGSRDHTRVLISVKHAIINGKAVLLDGDSSINGGSAGSSGPSTIEPAQIEGDPLGGEMFDSIPENNDVLTNLMVPIPSNAVPTHGIKPIIVNHRIRWVIFIANPDGHTSELRCSLPIHVLDAQLLEEARRYTAATRRLLMGGPEVPLPEEEEEVELPSYPSHVRDRIATIHPPEFRAASDPASCVSPTPPLTPDVGLTLTNFPGLRSGHSTPLEPSLFSHLPHMPESGDNTSLEWINSELLLRRASHQHTFHLADEHTDSDRSRPTSRPASRRSSRPTSRTGSPEPHHHAGSSHRNEADHPSSHHPHQSHRNLHGFLKATMKPFTSITHNPWRSRAGSHGNLAELPDQHGPSSSRHSHLHSSYTSPSIVPPALPECSLRGSDPQSTAPQTASSSPSVERNLHLPLDHALTEVPDYDAASRGFLGGLPPLTSLQSLPSYEEAAMSVSPPAGGATEIRWEEARSPGPVFGPAQRARSEGDLVTRLGWPLNARRS